MSSLWWEPHNNRGVSDVLGVILVVSVVLIGVVAVVGFGVTGVTDTSDISDTAVERDLAAFAQETDRLAVHRQTDHISVDLSMAGEEWVAVDERAGSLELAVETDDETAVLLNESLGELTYESPRSGAQIAYQSGLVLSSPDDSTGPGVVRSNAFTHRVDDEDTESLTLHLIQLAGVDQFDRKLSATARNTESVESGTVLDGERLVMRISTSAPGGWELAMREVFPAETTISRSGSDELELVYDIPTDGLFLHAFHHEVAIDGQ